MACAIGAPGAACTDLLPDGPLMHGLRLLFITLPALALVWPAAAQPSAHPDASGTLVEQLRSLSDEHGFQVQGIDKVADAPARRASGPLNARLRVLLDGYNHVLEGTLTEVTRVIILSAKTKAAAGFSLQTSRKGAHHSVTTVLDGIPGRSVRTDLLVDTGASTLVLPASLMGTLGFSAEDLPERDAQTVNGRVSGRLARLAKVSVGGATVADVEALFVADDRIGESGLLGMSFLEHFTLTINDADSRLFLSPR